MLLRFILAAFFLLWISGFQSCKTKQKAAETRSKKQTTRQATTNTSPKKIPAKEAGLEEILGLSSKEIKRSELYSFVKEWYGVPYKYGGCKKSGVDCSCFANLLYENVYHQKIVGNAADLYKAANKIELKKAKEGDLLFFKINVSYVSHVGVLLHGKHFVHASTSKGVIVSNLEEAYYQKYFHSAGRVKHDD